MGWEDRLNDAVKSAISTALSNAVRNHDAVITPEHLLSALLSTPNSRAVAVLKQAGVNVQELHSQVKRYLENLPKGDSQDIDGMWTPQREPVVAERTKLVIGVAWDEMRRAKALRITSEHLLLAILQDYQKTSLEDMPDVPQDTGDGKPRKRFVNPNGHGKQYLENAGFDLATARNTIANFAQSTPPSVDCQEFSTTQFNPQKAPASKTPQLDQLSVDLTERARTGRIKPLIGRDAELQKLIRVMLHEDKNNAMIIGEPGVGKTAVVEALAQRIARGDVPDELKNMRLVRLDLNNIVAGTQYRGQMEERVQAVLKEVRENPNIITFIDEIHTLIGAGSSEGGLDIGNIVKQALARGELRCIGATTTKEYSKYFEHDGALTRRFGSPIIVEEPSVEETVEMLKGRRQLLEAHHHVTIPDESLIAAAQLTRRYVKDRKSPDAPLDVVDDACAKIRLTKDAEVPEAILRLEGKLQKLAAQREAEPDIRKKEDIREQELQLLDEVSKQRKEWMDSREQTTTTVSTDDVAEVISSWTGVPVKQLSTDEITRLRNMEQKLHERVIGQDKAITALSKAVRRAQFGLKSSKGTEAFVFLGPTGVGKTESARSLAEFLFGDESALVQIDMSEYMEKHSVSRLIGAPPGYVGYDEGGQLTERVRRKPYSVVLLDEVEKAHEDVFNILLQVLEDGSLTDGQGRKVDFSNTIFILTSNLGVGEAFRKTAAGSKQIGFAAPQPQESANQQEVSKEIFEDTITKAYIDHFRPELRNRIGKDNVVVFHKLNETNIRSIVDLVLANVAKRDGLKSRDLTFEVTEAGKDLLAKLGYDPAMGARPLKAVIEHQVVDQIVDGIAEGKFEDGATIHFDVDESGTGLRAVTKPEVQTSAPAASPKKGHTTRGKNATPAKGSPDSQGKSVE